MKISHGKIVLGTAPGRSVASSDSVADSGFRAKKIPCPVRTGETEKLNRKYVI